MVETIRYEPVSDKTGQGEYLQSMCHPLLVEKGVSIEMRDGAFLCTDVFRPQAPDSFRLMMTMRLYPKDIHF